MTTPYPTSTSFAALALLASLALGAASAAAQTAASAAAPTASAATPAATPPVTAQDDPFLWLEDVLGDKSLAWVRARNETSLGLLKARPEFEPIKTRMLDILNSQDKIPYVYAQGGYLINVWTDAANKRGLLRRTSVAEYKQPNPKWETVLDIDALGKAEGENWVYKGMTCASPAYARCMLRLSRGGADAIAAREFDMLTKAFVKDGFTVPEAKSSIDWKDADTLFVGSDFGPGSMTKSGYARTVRQWRRGTALANAPTIFEGLEADVSAGVVVDNSGPSQRVIGYRSPEFYATKIALQGADGQFKPIDKPDHVNVTPHGDWMLASLPKAWTVGGKTHPAGSLLVAPAAAFLAGERNFHVLFAPTPTTSMAGYVVTKNHIIINVLDNVASRLVEWQMPQAGANWRARDVAAPGQTKGTISIGTWFDPALERAKPGAQAALADTYTLNYADFTTPDSYLLVQAGTDQRTLLKALPARFDADGMKTEQRFATSPDGTKIPYFVTYPKAGTARGPLPTLLYGYGGFRQPQRPFYSAGWGTSWLERGGVTVVANIRGGAEYGPTWHQAALRENKQRSYDDFIAIAQDLIAAKITTPAQLGIYGGSNGGLLTGAVAMQRPDLFRAVISAVPLLDMRRFHTLLAGNSWMAEYGNPDVASDWAFMSKYSPYHNVMPATGANAKRYPRILFTTSTRDDRVHPGHARKMVARMQALGHEVLYFENIEGGHGGAADTVQRAELTALQFSYLWMQLGQPQKP